MRLPSILLALVFGLSTAVAVVADTARIEKLISVLRIGEVMDIMALEGGAYADFIADDLFPTGGGPLWAQEVARIYDAPRMQAMMTRRFAAELSQASVAEMLAFFTSPLGARVTGLEISARRAMLDPSVEEQAIAAYHARLDSENPELDRLTRFIEANDLIDANVVGGMNSNIAFYRGLVEGGAFPFEMTDEQILRDVWQQEPDIRSETIEWLYAYLSMAYHPLSDAELSAYTDLSVSRAGRDFNRALFAAFDVLFDDISYQLGVAAGQVMSGEDI